MAHCYRCKKFFFSFSQSEYCSKCVSIIIHEEQEARRKAESELKRLEETLNKAESELNRFEEKQRKERIEQDLRCETCGSRKFFKKKDLFICQVCGKEYSVEQDQTINGICIHPSGMDENNKQLINVVEGMDSDFDTSPFGDGVEITYYMGSLSAKDTFTVPNIIDGKPVRRIGKKAFFKMDFFSKLVVPPEVREIGQAAFANCEIKELQLSEGLRLIDNGAFYKNPIEKVYTPKSLISLGTCEKSRIYGQFEPVTTRGVFEDCENLNEILFHEGLKTIGDYCFLHSYKLKQVILPDSVDQIGHWAFFQKIKLYCTEFSTPYDLLLCKGSRKNYEQGKITVIPIPRPERKKTIVNGSTDNFKIEVLNKNTCVIVDYTGPDIEELIIPNMIGNLRVIGIKNCRASRNLRTLIISDGISYIESNCFCYSERLIHIQLPLSLERIGTRREDYPLKPYTVLRGREEYTIDPWNNLMGAFSHCMIKEFTSPPGLKYIESKSFSDCPRLEIVTLTKYIERVSEYAFADCEKLQRVLVPRSVGRYIDETAFGSRLGSRSKQNRQKVIQYTDD